MLIHLNGELVEHARASVSVFDRGFLFGDGVYEGLRSTTAPDGSVRIIGERHHIARMKAGLAEARITAFDVDSLPRLIHELLRANGLVDAFIYWQVTRGTPPGDAGIHRPRVTKERYAPTVLGIATAITPLSECTEPESRTVATRPDTRWLRGHLKSVSLLGNVIAAFEADEQGADDAILIRDNLVTEGTATNVFIRSRGCFITPSLDSAPMLAGVTRRLLLDHVPTIVERPVTLDELRAADEIMLVGTKTMVAAVTRLDGVPVNSGRVGPGSRELLALLLRAIERDLAGDAARRPAEVSPAR